MLARLFVFFGGLVVLALTAALIGPYFIDWTNYRADFEREASAILGRKVIVHGSATARLLPFPSVTFSDVTVEGAAGTDPAMTVETFSMDAELAPFMRGDFLIFDMRLVKPKGTISVGDNGTIDWAMRPSSPFDASRIQLEKLTVTEGQITVRHAASGRDHVLSEINADVSARSLAGPWRINGTLRADGRKAAIEVATGKADEAGAMRLRIKADPLLYPVLIEADGDVHLDKGAASYAGTFKVNAKEEVAAQLRGSDGKPAAAGKSDRKAMPGNRLSGKFALDYKRLSVDEFRFETGPVEDPYIADGKAFVDIGAEPRFSITADGAQVRLDEAAGGGEAGSGITLQQRLAGLEHALADLPKPTIPGSVEVNLPAIVAGDTTIRDVRLSAEPAAEGWAVKSAAATLPGRTTLEANGLLRTEGKFGFSGSLLLAVAQPSGFAAWISREVDEAIRRLPAAGFSAKVDLTPERQTFSELELRLGNAAFHGEIDSRRPADARTSVLIRLDGAALDFEGLSAFASLFVSDAGATRFTDTDLDLQVKAGPVSAGGLSADTLDTALRLREGTVEVDRLSIAGFAGATISATGRIKDFPAKPTGNLDASIISDDLAPLIHAVAKRYPDQPLVKELARRSASHDGLFADSRIDLVASAAENADGKTSVALSAKGESGATVFSAAVSGTGTPGAVADAPLQLTFSGKNPDATALLALYGLQTLPLGVTGPGQTELSAKGTLGGGLATAFSLTGDGMSARFEGSVADGAQGAAVKGKLALDAEDIEPWLMSTGFGLPGMGTGTPLQLAADADYANGLLVLSNLDGTIAEGAIAGDINAGIKNGVPTITGQLALDELDLYPAAAMILGNSTLESGNGSWATAPFQQKTTTPVALDLDLTAGSFSAGTIATGSDAHLSLRFDQDGLKISDLTAKLDDGEVSGLFELKNNDGTGLFSGQLKLTNADLSEIIEGVNIGGRGDFSTTLSAGGKTIEGLVAALSGSGTASLRGVSVPGINPDAFGPIIAKADVIGRDIDAQKTAAFAPALAGGGDFPAGDVEVAFTVAAGVLRAPPVTLANPVAQISAEIRGDLNDGTVAASGTVTYAAGDQALVGSEPALRFAVAGQPGATKLSFDTEPLAQFLTQRALEIEQARVEAMQAGLLEKQRLRREARYYAALQTERDRIAEEKRQAEEAARLQAEEEARLKAEAEARAKAEEEAKARAEDAGKDAEAAAARQAVIDAAKREQAEDDAAAAREAAAREQARRDLKRQQFPPPPEPEKRGLLPFTLDGLFKSLGTQ